MLNEGQGKRWCFYYQPGKSQGYSIRVFAIHMVDTVLVRLSHMQSRAVSNNIPAYIVFRPQFREAFVDVIGNSLKLQRNDVSC